MSQPDFSAQRYCGLESWAAKKNLGAEMHALKTDAIHAQALLHIANQMETTKKNPWRDLLLLRLQEVVNDAHVVLNELDYFRVQDELDVPPKGCINRLQFHARHAARAAAAKLNEFSSSRDLASSNPSSVCCVGNEQQFQDEKLKTPKPKFNRVLLSKKMTEIVEQLESLTPKVSTIISLSSIG